MPRAPWSRSLFVLTAMQAGACAEDSSFLVRWRLGRDSDSVTALRAVNQCTELGIVKIRVTTRDAAEAIVDEREFTCFPPGFDDPDTFAPGPEVGPGTYTIQVTALSRLGHPFYAIDEGDGSTGGEGGESTGDPGSSSSSSSGEGLIAPPEEREIVAFDTQEVVVAATGEGQKVDFSIVGVPECDDGVDNDHDGTTDLADISCRGSRLGVEAIDTAALQITLLPRLLGDNPHATCAGLGIRSFLVDVAGPTGVQRALPCSDLSQTFSTDLAPGDYTLSLSALGFLNEPLATLAVPAEAAAFSLAPSAFLSHVIPAEVTIPSFIDPIEAEFGFSAAYELASGDFTGACDPDGLLIDRVRATLLDQDGAAIAAATLVEAPPLPAAALDGATLPCIALKRTRWVTPLIWDDAPGGYTAVSVVVDAFKAGSDVPCFSNADAPEPAAPNVSFTIPLLRRDCG